MNTIVCIVSVDEHINRCLHLSLMLDQCGHTYQLYIYIYIYIYIKYIRTENNLRWNTWQWPYIGLLSNCVPRLDLDGSGHFKRKSPPFHTVVRIHLTSLSSRVLPFCHLIFTEQMLLLLFDAETINVFSFMCSGISWSNLEHIYIYTYPLN